MTLETEIWKAHPDIGIIEVSTLGRVRMLDKVGSRENRTYSKKGHVLKQHDVSDYLQVSIKVDGKWTMKYVHRLVAQTFLANPDNLPQINHKNCIRTDNNVENLEWCSRSYNIQYREKYGEALGHPVLAINLSTLKVSKFPSQNEASRKLGVSQGNINKVIKGKYKYAGGYLFVNDDGHADYAINRKLHEIGKTGLKIKQGR